MVRFVQTCGREQHKRKKVCNFFHEGSSLRLGLLVLRANREPPRKLSADPEAYKVWRVFTGR